MIKSFFFLLSELIENTFFINSVTLVSFLITIFTFYTSINIKKQVKKQTIDAIDNLIFNQVRVSAISTLDRYIEAYNSCNNYSTYGLREIHNTYCRLISHKSDFSRKDYEVINNYSEQIKKHISTGSLSSAEIVKILNQTLTILKKGEYSQ